MKCPYCYEEMINTYSDTFENYGIDGTGEVQVYVCQNEECQCEAWGYDRSTLLIIKFIGRNAKKHK